MPPFPESPRCLSPFQGNLFSLHCLDFQAEDRLTPRWHVGQPCGKASWESLVGKPRRKATDLLIHANGSVTLLLQLGWKRHVQALTRDKDRLPWGDSRSTPRFMSVLERKPQEQAPTTQGPRPRHRLDRNPVMPRRNSHGEWPFLRPPECVPEVPVLSREHLPHLEKIQEVPPPGEMRPISVEASRG